MVSTLLLLGMLWRLLGGAPSVDCLPWKMERFGLPWYHLGHTVFLTSQARTIQEATNVASALGKTQR